MVIKKPKRKNIGPRQIPLLVFFGILGCLVGGFSSPRKQCCRITCSLGTEAFQYTTALANAIIGDQHLTFFVGHLSNPSFSTDTIRDCFFLEMPTKQSAFSIVFSSNEEANTVELANVFSELSVPYLNETVHELKGLLSVVSKGRYSTLNARYAALASAAGFATFFVLGYASILGINHIIPKTKEGVD